VRHPCAFLREDLGALTYAVRPGISGNVISENTAFLLKPDSNEPTPLCVFRGVFRARTWGTYWRTRLALLASAHRNSLTHGPRAFRSTQIATHPAPTGKRNRAPDQDN
jgi:hypothetical protein